LDNHAVYTNEELDRWNNRSGLLEQERYLIEKYLENRGKLIEAGTGGGRISLEITKKYKDIDIVAFDFVKEMIETASAKSENINFLVADASDLSIFDNECFDFALYLQQIVSFVPLSLIPILLEEIYRILKKDGIVILSFLNYNGRVINPILSTVVNSIRVLRGENWERQNLPWLKLGGKINLKFLGKNQAKTYWFRQNEIETLLESVGFTIIESTTAREISKLKNGNDGMLYIVCKK